MMQGGEPAPTLSEVELEKKRAAADILSKFIAPKETIEGASSKILL
jgi:hypothetical protein